MRCLVTGINGQLGFDCLRELASRGYTDVKGIDINDADITNEAEIKKLILHFEPDVIFHNAAWTNVDGAEANPDKVFSVNALGTKYIAEAAKTINAKMIYISTDYVFDGKGAAPFEVNSPKNGLSVYGKTKSQGEDFVINTLSKYFIVRISWVFGKNGKNFVRTMLSLAERGLTSLSVVADQIGSVTYTKDLARLLVDMAETDKFGIYHATNEGFISWADFAEAIFAAKHIPMEVKHVSTEQYLQMNPNQAKRPLNSRMSKQSLIDAGFRPLPVWQDALARFLKEIENED